MKKQHMLPLFFLMILPFRFLFAQNNIFPSSGNVGIGTLNPSTLLHLDISSTGQSVILGKGADPNFKVGYWQDRTSNSSGTIVGEFNLNYNGLNNAGIRFLRGESTIGGFLTFTSNNGTERMRIATNGNVGIGTTHPTNKLEVNGTIRAREVKLEATNWPDYVFSDNYELRSLEELKSFITQKGHLPGLKSAKQYGEDGVNMLELNQLLLEKMEELTLYLLEQEKRIGLLEKKLSVKTM
ncbi:hypothetical protein MM239_18990 [Belliella sp. DSM 111904]|uniref:Chaperone of endosialidase n=1 Tax=Belliella filtrata TaxID=2923435 RepID=A0ABS9V505_9BACT|nr:hypothetical protein [Belliella filtrata]MCH7411482.1 hypothetical protein [Belliella filtrata]